MRFLILFSLFISSNALAAQSLETPFEKEENYSATYFETIEYYENLQAAFPRKISLEAYGQTDSGYPLHVAVLSNSGIFAPEKIKKQGKVVLLINNAIHPGEPCGVDATMMFLRDIAQNRELRKEMENVVIVAIPFYNIGGGLNRGSFSRANQDGPVEHGFRGNARNLDLNRDFIKTDSKNAQTFTDIWNMWQPDVFLDNHTSNGADYQYTMTMIATQKDKLAPVLSQYLQDEMLPDLYSSMKSMGDPMSPYVNVQNTPDGGIYGFLDLPRYSSGYAAIHNVIGFMGETHMLKPFKSRVQSTYNFMLTLVKKINADAKKIKKLRLYAQADAQKQKEFALNWEIDLDAKEEFLFKGYAAKYKPSEVSGLDRLYYDRAEPYEKNIPFFNTYKPSLTVTRPASYLIPRAYIEIVQRLLANGVRVERVTKNVLLPLEMYYIDDFKTTETPYEGHYLHYDVKVRPEQKMQKIQEGDFIVPMDQFKNRFIVETLEPQAPDSYFAWNFFDGILMQKEYFSSYVFEDVAADILKKNPKLREELEQKKADDPEFAASARAQLDFVYKKSPYYEETHRLYPIGRLMTNMEVESQLVELERY